MEKENQQIPPAEIQTPIKTSRNLSFAKALSYGFVIASIGVAIAVEGYLLGTNKTPPAAQISVSPTLSPDPTANWKTYNNDELGFEVMYPIDWIITERSRDFIDIESRDSRLFSIQILRNQISPSTQITNTATFHKDGHTIFLSDAFYTADSPVRKFQPIDEIVFDQILSTFRFD